MPATLGKDALTTLFCFKKTEIIQPLFHKPTKYMNCPSCNRLLYSRIQAKCGHCGAELPPECLLPEVEIDKLRQEQDQIAERRAAAKEEEAAERVRLKRKYNDFR